MQTLLNAIRTCLAMRLVALALRVFPRGRSERDGLFRGRNEQRLYDRYEAFTRLLKNEPLPFDRWREIRSTFFLRNQGAA